MSPRFRSGLFQVLGVLGLAAGAWFVPYSLVWNPSPSIPTGLYLSKRYDGMPLLRESLVCFVYEEPAWAAGRRYLPPGFRICKPITGVAGDTVEKENGQVRVLTPTGQTTVSVVPSVTDRRGAALSTQALRAGPVAVGEVVLLASRYPNSLDSRYLGAVPVSKLTHQIWPLWVKE